MSNVSDSIKAAIDLANGSYKSGYDEGYREGFNEGLQAASDLIAGKSAEQVIVERQSKGTDVL